MAFMHVSMTPQAKGMPTKLHARMSLIRLLASCACSSSIIVASLPPVSDTRTVQMWEHARNQVAVPPGRRAVLSIGGELSLWNPFLLDWLVWMRSHAPDIGLRAQVGVPDDLLRQVSEGVLDIAILYTPTNLRIEPLLEETLVLVTATRRSGKSSQADYVFVDWGVDFARSHNR